jgi:hypothetical protein
MKSIASSRFAIVYAPVPLLVIAVLSARCGRSSPNRPPCARSLSGERVERHA